MLTNMNLVVQSTKKMMQIGRLYPLSLYQNLEIWIIHRIFATK